MAFDSITAHRMRLAECVIVIWVDNRKVFRFSDITLACLPCSCSNAACLNVLFLLYELNFSTRESIICVDNIRTRNSSHRPSVLAPFRGGPSGRSLERGHALLSSASRPASGAAKCRLPRGCVWLPPRSAKAALPLKGARLSVRTAPAARESGRLESLYFLCGVGKAVRFVCS